MKIRNNINKTSLFKKIFIKICRLLDYEIIDQGSFYVPTQEKFLNENLSIEGKKSLNIPLGETKITRKVEELTVIFRSCMNINMLTQSKNRLFDKEKSEYTFRSLNSIISSLKYAQLVFSKVRFKIIVVDHNSKKNDLDHIKNKLKNSGFENSVILLNIKEFVDNIKDTNAKGEKVTDNQISNMANIHKSLVLAKEKSSDLIYFVEDDYIHQKEAITEMLSTYERISSQIKKELILCPSDYPYLYTSLQNTNIFLGLNRHWRRINETLCTFLTSKTLLDVHWEKFVSMCQFEHYPFELPLHEIYKLEYCLSPIPSVAFHCTNVNSIFGISPNFDWKKVWDENK